MANHTTVMAVLGFFDAQNVATAHEVVQALPRESRSDVLEALEDLSSGHFPILVRNERNGLEFFEFQTHFDLEFSGAFDQLMEALDKLPPARVS